MSGTYLTKIKNVSNLRARVDLLSQIIDEKLEKKSVRVGVTWSWSRTFGPFGSSSPRNCLQQM